MASTTQLLVAPTREVAGISSLRTFLSRVTNSATAARTAALPAVCVLGEPRDIYNGGTPNAAALSGGMTSRERTPREHYRHLRDVSDGLGGRLVTLIF